MIVALSSNTYIHCVCYDVLNISDCDFLSFDQIHKLKPKFS
jgi:hypothetical protein